MEYKDLKRDNTIYWCNHATRKQGWLFRFTLNATDLKQYFGLDLTDTGTANMVLHRHDNYREATPEECIKFYDHFGYRDELGRTWKKGDSFILEEDLYEVTGFSKIGLHTSGSGSLCLAYFSTFDERVSKVGATLKALSDGKEPEDIIENQRKELSEKTERIVTCEQAIEDLREALNEERKLHMENVASVQSQLRDCFDEKVEAYRSLKKLEKQLNKRILPRIF
jgi:hypothetical protein